MGRPPFYSLLLLGAFGVLITYLLRSHSSMSVPLAAQPTGAIIVGAGLAGLSAACQLLSHNIPVRILERSAKPGGNSMKASSGINGAPTKYQPGPDTTFYTDTVRSAGNAMSEMTAHREALIGTLANNASSAISWLETKGVDQIGRAHV